MEKNNNKKFVYNQENLFKNYLKCMEDHYNEFFKLNDQNIVHVWEKLVALSFKDETISTDDLRKIIKKI